jgi:glycosyltransferase involved in cell wall biosynthesis
MVNVTATLAEAGRIAHGTTRVERGIVGGLIELDPPGLAFCRFDRTRQGFVEVSREEVAAALAKPPAAEARRGARAEPSPLARTGKRVEWMARRYLRDPLLSALNALRRRVALDNLPAGTTFVSVGETRFDLRIMADAVARNQAIFVSTIFDVLPIEAARRGNPSPVQRRMIADFDTIFLISRLCLCISQATLRDVEAYAEMRGLARPDCIVLPMADALPEAAAVKPAGVDLAAGRYVLAVGSITARKNQRLLVDIWKEFLANGAHPAVKLVLVGNVAEDSRDLVLDIRSRPDLAERLLVLENADDAALAWLYANCRFTVFPSFLEGFGLPVAESLGVGKLCVASSTSAVPEAAQGQAILLSPHDRQAWIATISELIENDGRLHEAEQRITSSYHRRTWTDTAGELLEILDSRGLRPAK